VGGGKQIFADVFCEAGRHVVQIYLDLESWIETKKNATFSNFLVKRRIFALSKQSDQGAHYPPVEI
jgi:hypothetical protein